jgi:hypothetical protein
MLFVTDNIMFSYAIWSNLIMLVLKIDVNATSLVVIVTIIPP